MLSILPPDAVQVTRTEPVSFCSHCGRAAAARDVRTRICTRCELGLILQAERALAPIPGQPFLVTDAELLICAVSDGAERLLEREEPAIIHRPVIEFLDDAELIAADGPRLPDLLRAAALRPIAVTETKVNLAAGGGGTHTARLGTCGPPTSALLVIGGAAPLAGAPA